MTSEVIKIFSQIPGFYDYFIAYFLIFVRLMGFFQIAPIFRRKEIVGMAKIGMAMLFSGILVNVIKIEGIPKDLPFVFLIFMNLSIGMFLGLICNMIFSTIQAAGDLANNQMALSSASMFDPSTRTQTSIIGNAIAMFGLVIFCGIGGLHWLFKAFVRSFEIFPLSNPVASMTAQIPLDYWIIISGNIIFLGFQIVAPIFITTLAIDIILGIISKTAPQINVFQLSFVLKPTVGAMVLLATLPLLMRVIEDYFMEFNRFF